VQHIVEHRPFLHCRPSSRGRAASAPPPPLAGDLPDRSITTNRSRVSPIASPRRLFATPSPTVPPASLPSPSGPRGGTKGLIVKVLRVLGGLVLKDSSQFYGLIQCLVNSISIHRKIRKKQTQFCCA
jgi:hypothetical protein